MEIASKTEMVKFLKTLVKIDSSTYYKKGIDNLGEFYADKLKKLKFKIDIKKISKSGNVVVARKYGQGTGKVSLIAHMDIAYSKGVVEKRKPLLEKDVLYGPGVADCKGGLVTLYYGLKALLSEIKEKDYKEINIILSGGEEQGSIKARKYLVKYCLDSDLALSFEPARADGSIVKGRWGVTLFNLDIQGKVAHALNSPEKGVDALEILSKIIIALKNLSEKHANININFGKTYGGKGIGINVPEKATTKICLNYKNYNVYRKIKKDILGIFKKDIPHKRYFLDEIPLFVPMRENKVTEKYINIIKEQAKFMKLNIRFKVVGSPGDAGFISDEGIPVICGMGPVGGNLHSKGEYLKVDSLSERSRLVAMSLKEIFDTI